MDQGLPSSFPGNQTPISSTFPTAQPAPTPVAPVSLPVAPAPTTILTPTSAAAPTDPSRTILIAEDEEFLRRMLVETFQGAGFQVLEAPDGRVALDLALKFHPRVSILDIMMPNMDGLTALQHIRQDFWGKNATVIILTNLTADNQILQNVSAALPSYYFIKSNMEPDQLLLKVQEILTTPANPLPSPTPQ